MHVIIVHGSFCAEITWKYIPRRRMIMDGYQHPWIHLLCRKYDLNKIATHDRLIGYICKVACEYALNSDCCSSTHANFFTFVSPIHSLPPLHAIGIRQQMRHCSVGFHPERGESTFLYLIYIARVKGRYIKALSLGLSTLPIDSRLYPLKTPDHLLTLQG